MDYSQYIPVLCRTEGSFLGKSYWEKISCVVGHNGKSVDSPMTKSDFEEGDEVVIRFDSRDYSGVVKYEKVIATHSQRGSQSPPPVQNLESGAAAATAAEHPEVSHNVIEGKHYTPKKRRSATKRKGELLSCNTVG